MSDTHTSTSIPFRISLSFVQYKWKIIPRNFTLKTFSLNIFVNTQSYTVTDAVSHSACTKYIRYPLLFNLPDYICVFYVDIAPYCYCIASLDYTPSSNRYLYEEWKKNFFLHFDCYVVLYVSQTIVEKKVLYNFSIHPDIIIIEKGVKKAVTRRHGYKNNILISYGHTLWQHFDSLDLTLIVVMFKTK